jgi:hypothetical protein
MSQPPERVIAEVLRSKDDQPVGWLVASEHALIARVQQSWDTFAGGSALAILLPDNTSLREGQLVAILPVVEGQDGE